MTDILLVSRSYIIILVLGGDSPGLTFKIKLNLCRTKRNDTVYQFDNSEMQKKKKEVKGFHLLALDYL